MSTVLEELLVKIGFDVDKTGLENAQKSVESATNGATKADEKQNKTAKDRLDTWEKTGEELDRNKSRQKERKRDEEGSLDRGKMLNKELNTAKGLLGRVAGGWIAAGAAAGFYASKTIKSNDAQIKFSRSIGVSFEKVKALQAAADKEGASAEDVISTLGSLTSVIGATNDGVQNLGLALLGISTWKPGGGMKDALGLLMDVTDAIQGLPEPVQLQRLQQVGIPQAMLPVMQQGRDTLRDYLKAAEAIGVTSEENAKKAEKSMTAWSTVWDNIKSGTQEAIGDFADFGTSVAESTNIGFDQLKKLREGEKLGLSEEQKAGVVERRKAAFESMFGQRIGSYLATPPLPSNSASATNVINNVTINADGLNETQAKQVFTESMREIIRTSKNNNDQKGEL